MFGIVLKLSVILGGVDSIGFSLGEYIDVILRKLGYSEV